MGKSRGGLSTKIYAAVDAMGNPVRLLLTPGQASKYRQAEALIEGFTPEAVLADKGYDSDAFIGLSSAGARKRSSPRKEIA
ncbi:transposase [Pseudomonas sp. GD03651]|uniref:transposase n=1 Tax=Pseudomonadota TaxID=1224 RepID=UPI0009A2DE55|nr:MULTISPECIES: transposase [Pseudomonadota]ELV1376261.1 transposase [Pseudomonas aeruginosa]TXI00869.1 MAG: transposase [Pseudomonas monteilii]ELF6208076.1 transposase [Pseudomonas putida]ELU0818309.1 transposase [Pseudomonas putida]MBA1265096.1 transposase [Stutzerimonas stutzeri]